jgi:putative transposase
MATIDEQIALFKFKIIAPALQKAVSAQQVYFREQAKVEHEYPGNKNQATVTFQASTFKKWLHLYRKYDFDGLRPHSRCDRGTFRKIPAGTDNVIKTLLKDRVIRTVKTLYKHLCNEGYLDRKNCTYQTFVNFMKSKNLWKTFQIQKKRKSWRKESVNMLWTGDFTYSIFIKLPGQKKRKQVYLCAFIDDHSRLITGAAFNFTMDTEAMEKVLKAALDVYGIPNALYLDNGGPFVGKDLQIAGAKLGFEIIHSKPGEPKSRGKIERFFKTIKDGFIDPLILKNPTMELTLEELNENFKSWLFKEYQHSTHSAIEMTPHDCYMAGLEKVRIRRATPAQIDEAFFHSLTRKVSGDALVSINNIKYEVPGKFIKQEVTLHSNPATPGIYYIYEDGIKEPHKVIPLDSIANSNFNK